MFKVGQLFPVLDPEYTEFRSVPISIKGPAIKTSAYIYFLTVFDNSRMTYY
jgi:hypothetical protein